MIVHNCFVYGTLMSPEVVQTLVGRMPSKCQRIPAFLPNFKRHPVKGVVYPGIIPCTSTSTSTSAGAGVHGYLLSGLSQKDMDIFDWFEADEYTRSIETIQLLQDQTKTKMDSTHHNAENDDQNVVKANVYVWTSGEKYLKVEEEWDYENFRLMELESYLRRTVRPCREEILRLGVGDADADRP